MRYNGTLQYEIVSGGEVDELGRPTGAEVTWSEPIPCSIKTNTDTRKGVYEDGEYRRASFTVLVERPFSPDVRIRLERYGEQLGEYDVLQCEPFPSSGRVRIIV